MVTLIPLGTLKGEDGTGGADDSSLAPIITDGEETKAALAEVLADSATAPGAAVAAKIAQVKAWARNPDLLISGTVTRDANNAATSAPVVWPDGTPGTYTALVLSSAFPGAVDSYKITYGSPPTKTYTQGAVTRNAAGAVIAVPAIGVS